MSLVKYELDGITTVPFTRELTYYFKYNKSHPDWPIYAPNGDPDYAHYLEVIIIDFFVNWENSQVPGSSTKLSSSSYNVRWAPVNRSSPRFKYIEYKNSINSPSWFHQQVMEVLDLRLTSPDRLQRRPKKPIYQFIPRKDPPAPKEPTILTMDKPFKVPKDPRRLQEFNKLLNKRMADRETFVRKVNVYRLSKYNALMRKRELVIAKNAANKVKYDTDFANRLYQYKLKLARWEAGALKQQIRDKASRFKLKPADPPENPYSYLYLRPEQDTLMWFSWDSPTDANSCGKSLPVSEWSKEIAPIWPEALMSPTLIDPAVIAIYDAITSGSVELIDELDAKNIRKIYSKISKQEVHIGNLIAERRQTVDMLAIILKSMWALISFKKGLWKRIKDYLVEPKHLADSILAWKFGLEPLVKDAVALIDLISEQDEKPILTAHANSKQIVNFSTQGFSFSGSVELSYAVKYKLLNSPSRLLSRLGLTDPKQILWEVTPWSFVVDWFLPVGAWLQSISSFTGCEFYKGTRKVKLVGVFKFGEYQATRTLDVQNCPQGAIVTRGSWTGEYISRIVLDEPPDRLRIFRFKNPLSWSHAVEALSLILQRLR